MAPSGRKHGGKAGKPAQEDQTIPAFDFEEERKELSGSEEDLREGAYMNFLAHLKNVNFITFVTMNRKEELLSQPETEQSMVLNASDHQASAVEF